MTPYQLSRIHPYPSTGDTNGPSIVQCDEHTNCWSNRKLDPEADAQAIAQIAQLGPQACALFRLMENDRKMLKEVYRARFSLSQLLALDEETGTREIETAMEQIGVVIERLAKTQYIHLDQFFLLLNELRALDITRIDGSDVQLHTFELDTVEERQHVHRRVLDLDLAQMKYRYTPATADEIAAETGFPPEAIASPYLDESMLPTHTP